MRDISVRQRPSVSIMVRRMFASLSCLHFRELVVVGQLREIRHVACGVPSPFVAHFTFRRCGAVLNPTSARIDRF